jgi:16S rRNA (guanine527-N7)-methyltransferase
MMRHGIELNLEQADRLWAFHSLLRRRNRELNMTRIHNFENMVAKHYADSMLVAKMVDLPSPLLDIGTGAGFPAIPLKILRPDLEIIMAEGRKKRVAFLEEAIELLRLEGIEAKARKITGSFDRTVPAVITRAFEGMPDTLVRIRSFLEAGGLAVFMKGPNCDEEVALALEKGRGDYALVEDRCYTIPETPHQRRLVVFRKESAVHTGKILSIESPANKTLLSLKKLLSARGLRKAGQAILHGRRVVEEALLHHRAACRAWISRDDAPPPPGELAWYRLAPPLFRELDLFGTASPLLLIDMPAMETWSPPKRRPSGCTLFVPFQDPENVGSVIRSAAGFGVRQVVLLEEAAHPFLPKACRAAGTSLLKVKLAKGPPLDNIPAGEAFFLSQEGEDLNRFTFPRAFGLVAGLEGKGLPKRFRKDRTLSIPMAPGCESLNAAAAVSVALYAWRLQEPLQ